MVERMSKILKNHLPKTPEEAIAHLVKIGFYKPPLVRHVRNALVKIGEEWRNARF